MADEGTEVAASSPFQAVITREDGVIKVTDVPTDESMCLYEKYTDLSLDLKSPLEICSQVFRTGQPQTVDIIAHGSLHAPAVTIHIAESVISNMPALCTEAEADTAGCPSDVIKPPVPLWALASTALLQEGALDVEKFLDDPCTPPRFLSDTLQMAEFVRADHVLLRIQRWLDAYMHQIIVSEEKASKAGKTRQAKTKGAKAGDGQSAKRKRIDDSKAECSEIPGLRNDILKHIPVRFLQAALARMKLQSVMPYSSSGLLHKWVEACAPCLDLTANDVSTIDYKSILSCCREAGITELRTSGPQVLHALREGFSSNSSEPLGITCVHLQLSLLAKDLGQFSDALGPLAPTVVSLVLSEFDLRLEESEIIATGVVWVFFHALSQLVHLKKLQIPLETWRKLISRCPKVADVIRNLDGLEVVSMENERLLGKVSDGAVTLMELPPPERLQALAVAAAASKFGNAGLPTPGTPSSDSHPCTVQAGPSGAPSGMNNHAAAAAAAAAAIASQSEPNQQAPRVRNRGGQRVRSLSDCDVKRPAVKTT